MSEFVDIAVAISKSRGRPFCVEAANTVSGGSIHRSVCLEGQGQRYFVKYGESSALPMFRAEAEGLQALGADSELRVPAVIACDTNSDRAFLILEHLDLYPLGTRSARALGLALANLHRRTTTTFGWGANNFIGRTPQENTRHPSWPYFFATRRLLPQLSLAAENGMGQKFVEMGHEIADRLAGLFTDYHPQPSLLHGDLWSGNVACLSDGAPVMFDPAIYYGDREADLAMAELFGGFPESFYIAYRSGWPLDDGYETRKTLYNLYHILNHFNLFGASYLGQVQRMMSNLRSNL